MLNAGIIDQDVGPAELVGATLHHCSDFLGLGHIRPVVKRAERVTLPLDLAGVAEAVDHQLRALRGERLGDSEADAGG